MAKPDDEINQASDSEVARVKQRLLKEINRLRQSNNLLQIQCLLSRTEFIALDIDYRIVSYTEGSTCLFKLLPEDRGREIASIVHTIKAFDINPMIRTSISEQKTVSDQVFDYSGRQYSLSATPYLSHDHCIGGCIICIDKLYPDILEETKSIYVQQPDQHTLAAIPDEVKPKVIEPLPAEPVDSNYHSLFEESPVGYLVLRRDASVKFANRTIARMLDTNEKAMIGTSFMEFVETKCRDNFLRSIWRGWRDQASDSCEIKLKHGKKSFDAICHILAKKRSHDGPLELRLNISDISAIKHREKREKTFFAIAGHELRTPLTNIKLALDMAMKQSRDESFDGITDFINVAHRAATRLQNLADSMLDYNSAVSGSLKVEKQRTDLLSLIQDIVLYQDLDPSKKTVFNYNPPENEIWVHSDPDRLYQVIVNLLRNAARHSPPDCPVTITVEQTGKWVRVSIIDLGAGVDETIKHDLFEPFIQAEHALEDGPNKGSHGLGLSISRSIIELLGGRIGYRRTEEEETCFFFEIPVS
jgi:signal transduction histidine kinase